MRSAFSKRVFDIVSKIPKGSVMTYKQVATAAGNPKACRAVVNILNSNSDPRIPCHRVIRSDGTPGGYNRGTAQKQRLLQKEL
ncbi:MGMT family protein [Patescibacteria group bacterium]|nr:MGMT family protein [Patescibacteria group bacterium]MBU1034249.1 MGMT family protein [Patescibacteria group bacterium]MBU1629862.1 MGMT family protein [Patescibacteria group bacterium]MBU1907875.1 MGMT family protein [Patescibacteria group bacterium]